MKWCVVQAIVKQWEKNRQSEMHRQARTQMPVRYAIKMPPASFQFDNRLLLDVHGGYEARPIECSRIGDDVLRCDRLAINAISNEVLYCGAPNLRRPLEPLGKLDEGAWLQCRYNWRYSVFRDDLYFWLYEEVVLNIAATDRLNQSIFVDTDPVRVFCDFGLSD